MSEKETRTLRVSVGDMDCPDCGLKIEKRLRQLSGVETAEVNFMTTLLTVNYQPSEIKPRSIEQEVENLGFSVIGPNRTIQNQTVQFLKKRHHSIATCGLLVCLGFLSSLLFFPPLSNVFYFSAILLGGYSFAAKAFYSARHWILDMNVLMSLAVLGAVLLGDHLEAASIVFLFSFAQWLETYSVDRSRKTIRQMIDFTPAEASVRRGGLDQRVEAGQVRVGERVMVRPGEKIPFDGKIVKGFSSVNQASMTGESLPVDKKENDQVYAGTLNLQGSLEIEVTHLWKESRMARIIHMVEEASGRKAQSQRFVDVFAKYYTPAVIGFAFLAAVIPALFLQGDLNAWFYRALVLVVIACPCALVISTPVTIISGLSTAAREGILIKGGLFLEELGRIKTFVFDKTGTLTAGNAEVKGVYPLAGTPFSIIQTAASIEKYAKHPVAEAIVAYATREKTGLTAVHDFQALPGLGGTGQIEGQSWFVGNHRYFEERGLCSKQIEETLFPLESQGYTSVLVGNEREVLGIIALSDTLRPETGEALKRLREEGIGTISMVTGDNRMNASAIASQISLDEFHAEILPDEKANMIGRLRKKFDKVAMVGDGINDAPALAAATVGIAMGEKGTEVSMETADMVLMSDNLMKIPFAVRLGKETLKIIKQNVALSIGIKMVFLALAVAGWSTLWMAVAADMGASLLVIGIGMRITFLRP
ncbi:MAG: cadmium-translocating P-type ATPase [Nitrospirae bacterium]|nr:cadmium-translocating P-type ATPase [Nitrospirota bacterium]